MSVNRPIITAIIAGLLTTASVAAQSESKEHPAADNTAVNASDRDTHAKTPMDQGNDKDAIAVTAAIRKAVVDDSSLSSSAHNVKIITSGDTVTIRGPVASADEKQRVEALATKIATGKHIRNEISIAK